MAKPENKAMVECNMVLIDSIKNKYLRMAESLLGAKLVTEEVRDKAVNPTNTAFQASSTLVGCVRDFVKARPDRINDFIEILLDNDGGDAANALQETMRKYGGIPRSDRVLAQQNEPDHGEEENGRMDTNGHDAIEDFFQLSCFDWDVKEEGPMGAMGRGQELFPGPEDKWWLPNSVLKVYFMNRIPQVYYDDKDDQINTKQIIDWMNEWSSTDSRVPRFEKTLQRDQSDIRIEFCDNSSALIGTDARNEDGATMWLNLKVSGPVLDSAHCLKKYTVLHETGHVIGFYHEHQHPQLGTDLFNKKVVVADLMKSPQYKNRGKAKKFYDINFASPQNPLKDPSEYPFDKDSVMKYRAKKSWIKQDHHHLFFDDNSEGGGYLWPQSALTGELTDLDKKGAKKAYDLPGCKPKTQTGLPLGSNVVAARVVADESSTGMDLNDTNLLEKLKTITDWESLGNKLGLPQIMLDTIGIDHAHKGNEYKKSKMIQKWLSYDTSKSWGKLCKALDEMGEHVLAKEIRSRLVN